MKKFKLPIFWKFSLAIVTIVLVFSTINAYLIWNNLQNALQKESEKRGVYIALNLAEQAVNPLLYEDLVGLQELIDASKKLDPSIHYIYIVDKNNNPIVNTFEGGFPVDLLKLPNTMNRGKYGVQLIVTADKSRLVIRDIHSPIFSGELGYLHVGVLESDIVQTVNKTLFVFWLMVLFFLIVGILGAFSFSYFITNPIQSIKQVADHLDLNALEKGKIKRIYIRKKFLNRWKNYFRALDEIDELGLHFNRMIRRLEETYRDLKQANQKLIQSEKMASVGIIATGLAHEVNNPIAGIKNCLRRINNKPEDMKQNQRYLKMMDEAVNRVENVVKNLLDFSRQQEFKFKRVQIKEIIDKAIELTAYRLEKSGISFSNEVDPDLPLINGSANHLEQVFVNLIINAIDAIEEKCEKTKNCSRNVRFRSRLENKYVIIEVKDSGIGIKKEEIGYIFNPFYSTKKIGYGTGLGLAVSNNIIQAHNGRIKVYSKHNEGATFEIYLPV